MNALLSLLDRLHRSRTSSIGAALLGLISGVLGSFAVLRQQSLLGDTLSHAALPGVCLGFIVAGSRDLGSILAGALVTAVLAALVDAGPDPLQPAQDRCRARDLAQRVLRASASCS